jgi:hypothetical protein
MTRSSREQVFKVLSMLFAAAPLLVSLVPVAGPRRDVRFLSMALAAFGAAALVRLVGQRRAGWSRAVVSRGLVTLAVATLVAAPVGFLLGATASLAVWPVALVFGLCFAASNALAT